MWLGLAGKGGTGFGFIIFFCLWHHSSHGCVASSCFLDGEPLAADSCCCYIEPQALSFLAIWHLEQLCVCHSSLGFTMEGGASLFLRGFECVIRLGALRS